jgi:hypothetical protein
MAGREVRMVVLKKVIRQLRSQLLESGIEPLVNDPLATDKQGIQSDAPKVYRPKTSLIHKRVN